MLPKQHRITKKQDYDRLFQKGRAIPSRICMIRWMHNELHVPRMGIIVSNKVSKKATIRNKIKRQYRAIIGKKIDTLPFVDFIIVAKNKVVNTPYPEIEADCLRLLKKIDETFYHSSHQALSKDPVA